MVIIAPEGHVFKRFSIVLRIEKKCVYIIELGEADTRKLRAPLAVIDQACDLVRASPHHNAIFLINMLTVNFV